MASSPASPEAVGAAHTAVPPVRRTRLALGASPRRLSYERRLRLWLLGFAGTPVALVALLVWDRTGSRMLVAGAAAVAALLTGWAAATLYRQLVRPLQTLANIVVALRENDFSLRVRGARRGDALGDLALETNLLAATLQQQRLQAREAVTLAERVIATMPTPVFAFDAAGILRLLNEAAAQLLLRERSELRGQTAEALGLAPLLALPDGGIFDPTPDPTPDSIPDRTAPGDLADGGASRSARWSVRRAPFRLGGLPHHLVVLSDVAAALREEERVAWQRLIRVLGHEINNSLAPIASIAGSLRSRLPSAATSSMDADLHRGLGIIGDRAGALHRFLTAYQRLSRLPAPTLQRFALRSLLEQVVQAETRLPVALHLAEPATLHADPDQLQQMLINLVRNAVEAALQPDRPSAPAPPCVTLGWHLTATEVVIRVTDNGPGPANPRNLFVPFYTTKPEGSGIGLVLAQQIAVAHGGSVRLGQRSGAPGCEALVYLPRS